VLDLGDRARGVALLEESLALCRRLGDRSGIALALEQLGRAALEGGDPARASALFAESLALRRDLGATARLIACLEGLAAVAGVSGQDARAARLSGAAAALRESFGVPLLAVDRARDERHLDPARIRLGAAAWDAAWQAGRALALDGAIAEAEQIAALVQAGALADPAAPNARLA